jgi:hypothetical protein
LLSYLEKEIKPEQTIKITISREGKIQEINLKLGVRPSSTT